MRKPILGKQTFLKDNTERLISFEKFITEVYERPVDQKPLYTGRYLVILKEGVKSFTSTQKLFESNLGFTVANSNDFTSESLDDNKIQAADALIYNDLGIALVGGEEEQIQILESANADFIIEPEKIVYVPDEAPATMNVPSTWGVNAIQADISQFTGSNVKVAVLDTGFDVDHPDFVGRNITTNSFVPDETIHMDMALIALARLAEIQILMDNGMA